MPIIKVWCLPQIEEEKLNSLHKALVRAVSSVEVLGVNNENDMTCLFPTDMMKYGLGTEIIIEVVGIYDKPDRTDEVRKKLAEYLVVAVREQFPDTGLIECFVYPFNPALGFASSRI